MLRCGAEGKLTWECDAPNSCDCCVALNGNVAFTCRIQGQDHRVSEVTPDKKAVWQFTDVTTTRHVAGFAILEGE